MHHAKNKGSQGLTTPTALATAPFNTSTVAPAAAPGFDDHTAQNALQQPQTAASTLPPPPVANGAPVHGQHAAKAKGV